MSVSWDDFINRYPEWSESTLRTRISELDEIGSGDEVVDVILDFPTEQLKGQLIRRAIRHKVIFSHDDFENLDGELSDADYRALAAYTGFDADCPHIDDNNLTWDDFYNNFSEWSSRDVMRRIASDSSARWQHCFPFFQEKKSIRMITEDVTETAIHVPHISGIATVAGITVTDISGDVSTTETAVHLEKAIGINLQLQKFQTYQSIENEHTERTFI